MKNYVYVADDVLEVTTGEVQRNELKPLPAVGVAQIVKLLLPAIVGIEAVNPNDINAVIEQ